jgi:hypothetical protein
MSMRKAVNAVGSLAVCLLLAAPAWAQFCPSTTYINLAWSGTNCSSADSSSRCGVGTAVTLTVTAGGGPYSLQSCETGVTWNFGDTSPAVTSTGNSVTHSFTSAGSFYVTARVNASSTTYGNYASAYVRVANGVVYLLPSSLPPVSEGAGSISVNVHTTFAPTTVDYYTSDYYGYAGTRYTATQGTLSFAAGEFDKTVSVPIIDDHVFTGNAQFTFALRNATNGVTFGDYYYQPYQTTITITENDPPPTLDFAGAFPLDISEAIGTFNVDVVRTGDLQRVVSVYYYGDSLQYGSTLTFNANETRKTIAIPIPHDSVWLPPRQRYITISSPSNGAVIAGSQYGSRTVSYNVVDDTPAPTIRIGDVSIVEGNSGIQNAIFPVTLSTALNTYLYVNVATKDGSATATDYVPGQAIVTFAPGETSKSFTVGVRGDTTVEPDETFTVTGTLYNDYNNFGKYVTITNGTCTIVNDDMGMAWIKVAAGTKGRMFMTLGNRPSSPDLVTLTSMKPSVATAPPSFVLAPASSIQSFEVTGLTPGTSTIVAKLPASAGGATLTANVDVYTPATLTARPETINVVVGNTSNVALTFSPAPASPLELKVAPSNANVQVPQGVTVDAAGNGVLAIKGLTAGDASITLTQPDANGAFTTTILVHVTAQPTGLFIASALPPGGPTAGGTQVSLTGQNFTAACTVTFGRIAATNVTLTSPTTLTAATPAQPAGTVDITATCGTDSFTLPNAFTYMAATPAISTISPSFGSTSGSTLVTVAGANMRSSCGVLFGGASAKIIGDLTPDKFVVSTPPHAASEPVNVTLQCGATSSVLESAFTYSTADEPSAVISDVDPRAAAPGQSITISGIRFRPTDAIAIDGTRVTSSSTTPTTHVVPVPPLPAGRVAVTLTDAAGHTSTTGPIFTVLEAVTPEITSVQPSRVTAGGELTINGKGFRAPYTFVLGTMNVGTIVDLSFNRAVVRVSPTFAGGTYTLGIANANGNLAAIGPKVDIAGSLTLAAASPQCASAIGGSNITITGTGFGAGTRVWIGGAEVPNVNVVNPTTIEVAVPEGRLGWTSVRAASAGGDADTLTRGVLYYSPYEPNPCTTPQRSRGVRH